MEMRAEMLFPEGKRKALTFSYDDGTIYDRELVKMMNTYGMKGTFNLNSGLFSKEEMAEIDGKEIDFSRIDEKEVKALYKGHEVASHTMTHPSLTSISLNMGMAEILKDRLELEKLSGQEVTGFAYPFGVYNEIIEELLCECGISYARTVESTMDFDLPQEFLEWHPTCHHGAPELMELAEKFCKEESFHAKLFYLWGHSYEFERYDNWQVMEDFLRYMQEYKEQIWIATNKEIADYVMDYRKLEWSSDGKILQNPTDRVLWYAVGTEVYHIQGGERQTLL